MSSIVDLSAFQLIKVETLTDKTYWESLGFEDAEAIADRLASHLIRRILPSVELPSDLARELSERFAKAAVFPSPTSASFSTISKPMIDRIQAKVFKAFEELSLTTSLHTYGSYKTLCYKFQRGYFSDPLTFTETTLFFSGFLNELRIEALADTDPLDPDHPDTPPPGYPYDACAVASDDFLLGTEDREYKQITVAFSADTTASLIKGFARRIASRAPTSA